MCRLICCVATALLVSTGSAMAALTATLKAGPTNALGTSEGIGSIYTIPAAGARFDISVTLDRLTTYPSLYSVQMQFVSNGNGAATLNRAVGGITSAGTSTRLNTPEWYGYTDCESIATMPLNATPSNYYYCAYQANDGLWNTSHTLMGFINVTVSSTAGERTFTITPVNVEGTDQYFESVFGQGVAVTIHQLPEPAGALLLFGALPFLHPRKQR